MIMMMMILTKVHAAASLVDAGASVNSTGKMTMMNMKTMMTMVIMTTMVKMMKMMIPQSTSVGSASSCLQPGESSTSREARDPCFVMLSPIPNVVSLKSSSLGLPVYMFSNDLYIFSTAKRCS